MNIKKMVDINKPTPAAAGRYHISNSSPMSIRKETLSAGLDHKVEEGKAVTVTYQIDLLRQIEAPEGIV